MSPEAADLWQRARQALVVARSVVPLDADAAASRAYYAAFYAVSAQFALEGQTFTKHSAVEAAVHRDLVRPGTWPADLGEDYSRLVRLRRIGDYGGGRHVPPDEAKLAVRLATAVLQAVSRAQPEAFTGIADVLPPDSGT